MPLKTALTGRIDRDFALARVMLERMPADEMTWKPHPRAFSLGGLGTHLAQLPYWGVRMLAADSYDLAGAQPHREALSTPADVLTTFDRHVDEWRRTLRALAEERLDAPWELRRGAAVLESLPRVDAIDRYVLHHLIHHRGQLSVYLRMLGVALPAMYGPSADQQP